MMLDRHEAHDNLNQKVRDPREAAAPAERPVPDREVPLPGVSAADQTAGAVQLWLDGEATEAEARAENDHAVAFWMRVHADAGVMREAKAPAHLTANIMAALPATPPVVNAPLAD
ncbi:MAG: hypothetical protein ACK6DR_03445 [Gemmatimonas sp.]|uniref:hypothetical protein n=2 Tax=Gemmatimonas sp. TaxID=1962908 RepID=UPI0022C16855|nr:hypothetical protein [Gemmatimonas sp.]MCA2986144.1 hypothetical protein [Gemmatimonas sp.]MCE2953078.1 hypothetical protein [Gemmatimonas sp.]MCZ8265782.1 hypothetical protein [Gemmatimonas sp.]